MINVVPWFGNRVALSRGMLGGALWPLDYGDTLDSLELPFFRRTSLLQTPYFLMFLRENSSECHPITSGVPRANPRILYGRRTTSGYAGRNRPRVHC